jgi:hypothetical protein
MGFVNAMSGSFLIVGWSPAWTVTSETVSQLLDVKSLLLPFPPYNGSPFNVKFSVAVFVVQGGSTPVPLFILSAASIKHQFCWSSFAAQAHANGPIVAAFCL